MPNHFCLIKSCNDLSSKRKKSFSFFLNVECSKNRVIGGVTAEKGMFPYMAYVKHEGGTCSGSLIAPDWVLTAAHCISEGITVLAGDPYILSSKIQKKYAKGTFVHPGYVRRSLGKYDVALINTEAFNMSASGIGLLELSGEPFTGLKKTCTVQGWGYVTDPGRDSDLLQYASVTARHGEGACPCADSEEERLVICLESKGKSPCYGDSGGPLICDGVGVGIAHLLTPDDCHTDHKIKCGARDTVAFYMYTCPVLDWLRDYVEDVPPTPKACTLGFNFNARSKFGDSEDLYPDIYNKPPYVDSPSINKSPPKPARPSKTKRNNGNTKPLYTSLIILGFVLTILIK